MIPRALAMAMVVCAAATANADVDAPAPLRASGQARGTDVTARDRAVDMAVREALLQALQRRIPTARITPYEAILERPQDFIAGFHIVDYDARDGITTVEIACQLHEDAFRAAIAEAWLKQATQKPRVALLAATRHAGDPVEVDPEHPAGALLHDALTRAGIEVVAFEELLRYESREALGAIAAEPAERIREFARAHLCEAAVLLIATVDTQPVIAAANVHESVATVTMFIASPHGEAPIQRKRAQALIHAADPAEAAEAAITNAAARLAGVVLSGVVIAAAAVERTDEDIIVTLEGALDAAQLALIAEHFTRIHGVLAVETLFHGHHGARLRIHFPQNPALFIEPALRSFPQAIAHDIQRIVDRDMQLRVGE